MARLARPLACSLLAALGLWLLAHAPARRQSRPLSAALPASAATPSGDDDSVVERRAAAAAVAAADASEVVEETPPVPRVGPSLLAGDLADLAGEAQRATLAGADFLHLDVFDGHWIPGAFTFGPLVVKALRAHVPKVYLDAHLCVTGPERYVEALAEAGANRFTFHVEATEDPRALAARARELGMEAGLAIAPATPVDGQILDLARSFDAVLVMTVPPGFGGQAFMPEVLPKLQKLRAAFPSKALEVDGGVNADTVKLAAAAGANEAVAGSAVFNAEDPAAVIGQLREGLERYARLPQ